MLAFFLFNDLVRKISIPKITKEVFQTSIFFFPLSVCAGDQLYIWDIGQGSSASIVSQKQCIHFDLGGEKNPIQKIMHLCKNKNNALVLSHFDYDHYNFVASIQRQLSLCIVDFPRPDFKIINKAWFRNLKKCPQKPSFLTKIYENPMAKNKNASSLIYLYKDKVLFTGDSGKKEEKVWSLKIPKNIQWIIVPHHGSNSSSGTELLARSKRANFIMSSRKEKYGHPHIKVQQRFKDWRRTYLNTHDWGSLIIDLN